MFQFIWLRRDLFAKKNPRGSLALDDSFHNARVYSTICVRHKESDTREVLETTSRVDSWHKEVQKPEDTEGQPAYCKP